MIKRIRTYLAGGGLGPLLLKAVTGSAGLRLAGMGFGFLVGVQLARGLGVTGYGTYGFAMSLIALLMVPAEFGLPQLLVRETAASASRGEWGKVAGLLIWSRKVSLVSWLIISAAVVLALAVGAEHIDRDLAFALLIGLAIVPFVAIGKTRAAVLRGLSHVVKGQLPDTLIRPGIHSALLLVAMILAIPLTPGFAMALGVIGAGSAMLLAVYMLRRALPAAARTAEPQTNSNAWRSSCLPMAMTEAMRILQAHSAVIMLGILATSSSVGVFKVAVAISVVVALPTSVLITAIAPSISSLYVKDDHARLQKLLTWASITMVAGVTLLAMPFILVAQNLISAVFGDGFADAAPPLQVLCLGAIATATSGTAGTLLNMTGHERLVRRASIESLFLLIVTMPVLILLAGATGAAIATVAAGLLWRFRMAHDCRRVLGLEPGLLPLLLPGGK